MENTKFKTAEQAASHTSLQTLADMKAEDFVQQLKQRGITSLEDLAKVSIGAARSGIRGGITSISAEDFPICYKFTVRPFVSRATDLVAVLDGVKNARF